MEQLAKLTTGIVVTFATLFALRLIGPLMGALAGWIVGLFFGNTIFAVLQGFGVNTSLFSMWQLGAALSFIGSFFVITIPRPGK